MLRRTTTTEPWLEARTAHALSGGIAHETPKRTSERGRRLLLVDDDDDVIAIMVPFLEEEGFEVATAMNGRDALEILAVDKPDVVILDLMMPIVSGWDVWDHMQQSHELSRVPVVVFTASGLGPGAFGATVPVVRKGASTDEILDALTRSIGAP